MPLLSEVLEGRDEATRRRLYTLFTRAAKRGELPALKLLDHFNIQGTKGQPREVMDYAYTAETEKRVKTWILTQETSVGQKGVTAAQVKSMTDEQLSLAIKSAGRKRSRTPKRSTTRNKLGG